MCDFASACFAECWAFPAAVLQAFGWAVSSVGDDTVTSFLEALLPHISLSCMYIFSFIVQAMLNNTGECEFVLFYFFAFANTDRCLDHIKYFSFLYPIC